MAARRGSAMHGEPKSGRGKDGGADPQKKRKSRATGATDERKGKDGLNTGNSLLDVMNRKRDGYASYPLRGTHNSTMKSLRNS